MVATKASIGYGTVVKVGSGGDFDSPDTFITLAEVIEVTPPNMQTDDVDATHFSSPNRTREYIAGLIEPGEASIVMNRIDGSATEVLLMGLQSSGLPRTWVIVWPNETTWSFLGLVKGYEATSPIDDRMTATCTIKVAGAQTITIPSPSA
jgi:predicted secreted protein